MPYFRSAIDRQRERRFGAALGLLHVVAALGSKLLLVPIILQYIDLNEFGLYQLIGAFVGYLALIDFGISATLNRFTAKYQALDDPTSQDNVFAMCLIIYGFLSLLLCAIGLFLYLQLDGLFAGSLTTSELATAKAMFVILLASICATILGRAFAGLNGGLERFVFPRLIDSLCALAKVGVVWAVLAGGHRAVGIVAAEATINLLILLLNAGYAVFVLRVRFKLHYWDQALFGEAAVFAFWTFLAALVVQINFRLGSVLLGVMTTTGLVAVYAIAMQINTLYNTLAITISSVFLPQITRLVVGEADGEQLTRAIIGPSRYQLMMVGVVLGGFLLFGRQFISLWAGPEFIAAWTVALFILVPVTIPICQNTILSILYAKSLNRERALIILGFAVLNGLVSLFLIPRYGLHGPAIATGLALLLGHGLALNLYYRRHVGLNILYFFRKVTERILPVVVVVTLAGVTLLYLPMGGGWLELGVRLGLYMTVYGLCMWRFGMHAAERAFFRSLLNGGLHRSIALAGRGARV